MRFLEEGRFKGRTSLPVPCPQDGEEFSQLLLFLLQYIFVSLISRDSVYDVLRRVCTHLQVPSAPCPTASRWPRGSALAPRAALRGAELLATASEASIAPQALPGALLPLPSLLALRQGTGRGARACPRELALAFSGSQLTAAEPGVSARWQSPEFLPSPRVCI